ncbi:MAG: hypothetical protein HOI47_02230 [Candidatus Scalindua sp.]|jgi:hypothetical protein|nr:hypothetical protein [Candidatus Scalindua sp.]
MSVELDLAKELVTNRAMVQKQQDEIKLAKGIIKDCTEREDEIVKELEVRFSEE